MACSQSDFLRGRCKLIATFSRKAGVKAGGRPLLGLSLSFLSKENDKLNHKRFVYLAQGHQGTSVDTADHNIDSLYCLSKLLAKRLYVIACISSSAEDNNRIAHTSSCLLYMVQENHFDSNNHLYSTF